MANSENWDLTVGEISFVIHRKTDASWALHELVNPRFHIMAFALAGSARYRYARGAFTLHRGDMLFFTRGVPHSAQSDSGRPWSFVSVAFDFHASSGSADAWIHRIPARTTMENDVETGLLFMELDRLWTARETGYLLRCRSIILQLFYSLVRAQCQPEMNVPHSRRIASIVELLQRNYTQSYSLDELSEKAGLSPSRFRTLFKQMTGHSVVRYQNWLRINKARDLLLTGEYTVTQAAEMVGLADVYYFSRLFTKMTGKNPSAFRNR